MERVPTGYTTGGHAIIDKTAFMYQLTQTQRSHLLTR